MYIENEEFSGVEKFIEVEVHDCFVKKKNSIGFIT